MAGVAQLVRASDCDSEGRRFETGRSPHIAQAFRYKSHSTNIFYLYSTVDPKSGEDFTLMFPNVNSDSMNVF